MTTTTTTTPKTNTIRIAIPVADGRLHGHFGGCREFALVQVDRETKVALHTDVLPAFRIEPVIANFLSGTMQTGANLCGQPTGGCG